MRTLFPVFFFFVFTVRFTELHELFRLPQLINHYGRHKSLNPEVSFPGFLMLHYLDHHPDDNDEEDDRQLPFKSDDALWLVEKPAPLRRLVELVGPTLPRREPFAFTAENIFERQPGGIFHPPRI
jgi:hypothetical protein